ncbi:hypothetical protein MEA186_24772 [Mesorhizobium amorphae CCNWGS0123]|uniref:Uncharacterized protein n=2 Tax=Mesorhizobium TaxID=68287 RepID=G6YG48_9HYPH|nr:MULTISPECIES: hypothetical protein [Mesorhizobium]EHH09229.1 hypothetical protein MEA186_24772 [Mesorhizobium amorphae CCNWGS0123]MCV3242141.1 hypothetical protein [Mesorhizobium sp. ZC-5]
MNKQNLPPSRRLTRWKVAMNEQNLDLPMKKSIAVQALLPKVRLPGDSATLMYYL